MATALRRLRGDTLRNLFLKLFWPEWLPDPRKRTQSAPSTALPTVPAPTRKATHVIHISAPTASSQRATPNGHTTGTTPQPHWWNTTPFSAVLGTDIQTGEEVSITEEAWRQALVSFGATGSGKTTFVRGLIRQVMQAGHGLILFELHRDLTKQVLADVPKDREKDVLLLDLTDAGEFPFGLSLFECADAANIHEVAKTAALVMHVLEKTWDIGPHTPVLAQVVRHITFIMVEAGLTLAEIPLLLWDDAVRAKLIATLTNSHTRLFWQQYSSKSPRERAEYTNSTVNKFDAYLTQPLLANILCQKRSTVNLRDIMDNGQILLVLLSPQLEEASRLIGTILISKLLLATFSRAELPQKSRRPFYVFADEWHRFASSDFATFFAEARKFRVVIGALATQTLEQLDDANRATALQAGSLVVFRVSGDDSKVLARSYDATPSLEQIGLEPQRSPVADVIGHLVRRGHTDQRVTTFAQTYLSALEKYAGTRMQERVPAGYQCFQGALMLTDQQVQQGRKLVNDCLYRCMSEARMDIPIAPLALYVLTTAQGEKIEYIFSPYLHTYTIDFFGEHYLRDFREGMAKLDHPTFLQDEAFRFVNQQQKKYRWLAESVVTMLTELRYCMGVLAAHPILVDTGQYVPQYRQRPYQDQENLIANDLSTLPNFHAKVRLLTEEHTIVTAPVPQLLSDAEVEARIQTIKQRMLFFGYTRPAKAVEEEVRKRHEELCQRPAVVPPPTHTSGRRNARAKPLTQT